METSEASLEQLRAQIHDYCEWMGQPVIHPDRDDLRNEAFSSQGTVNGQDVMTSIYDSTSNFFGQHYTDVFMKMISAFAVAAHLHDLKEELMGLESDY